MADYHSPTVLQPVIPVADITALERLLLEAVFDAEFDEDDARIYLFSKLGPNEQITVERDQLLAAFEESVAMPESAAVDHIAELLRRESRNEETEDAYLDIDVSESVWQSILQDIVRRSATIDEIAVTTSFTCSRMRPDGFGGAVMLITADTVLEKSTFEMLDELRAKTLGACSAPDRAPLDETAVPLETRTVVLISKGHVSLGTRAMLDRTPCEDWPCVGGRYACYGWLLYAAEENCGVGAQRIPQDLFAVMTWARRHGFTHVLLDRDAGKVDDLEWFGL